MSDSSKPESRREKIAEKGKGYAVIIATALTFISLMTLSTSISVYLLKQSLDPNVIGVVASMSQKHLSTTAWEVFSAIIVGVNAIISIFAYFQFRTWFRLHDKKKQEREHFKIKLWPLAGMGFLDAMAISVLVAFLKVTNTTLQGLDVYSVYEAIHSGSIYGILAVLISLPILAYVIVFLGPKAYHYIEKYEKDHHLERLDLPDSKDKKNDSTKETEPSK